jgi:hypothetical protein
MLQDRWRLLWAVPAGHNELLKCELLGQREGRDSSRAGSFDQDQEARTSVPYGDTLVRGENRGFDEVSGVPQWRGGSSEWLKWWFSFILEEGHHCALAK